MGPKQAEKAEVLPPQAWKDQTLTVFNLLARITMGRDWDVKAVFIPKSTASPTTTIKTTATPTLIPSSAHVKEVGMPQMAV